MNSIASGSSARSIEIEAIKAKGMVEVEIVLYCSSRSGGRKRRLKKKEERKGNQGKGTKSIGEMTRLEAKGFENTEPQFPTVSTLNLSVREVTPAPL